MLELTLNDESRERWRQDASAVKLPPLRCETRRYAGLIADELSPPADNDPYTALIAPGRELAERHLPREILEDIGRLKQPDGPTWVVIRNLPIDNYNWDRVAIPTDGKRPSWKEGWVSELVLCGAIQAAGLECLGYFEEADGVLVQEVVPVKGREKTNSGTGRKAFGFHTDNAIHPRPYRAEGIALMGLMNPQGVRTWLAPVGAILSALDPKHVDVLSRPLYRFPAPESFDYGGRPTSAPRPILTENGQGDVEISVALYSVRICAGRSEAREATAALDALEAVLVPPVIQPVVIGPGDLLLMSNVHCLHGRDAVPGRRWLQRVYYRESLDQLRACGATADTRLSRRFHTRQVLAG